MRPKRCRLPRPGEKDDTEKKAALPVSPSGLQLPEADGGLADARQAAGLCEDRGLVLEPRCCPASPGYEGLIAHTLTLRCQQGSRTVPAAFTGLRSHLTYSLYWSKTLLSLLTWCFMLAADTR
jgi:hypothetical protein